jgi:UDP-MurNAc hydroxylase
MATLDFVNHASYVLRCGETSLLHDPWIDGSAFDCGWDLLVPSRFGAEDFKSITHIWFSHEHPDHFSPANLKAIPPEQRARITVLYQNSIDHRVAKFCKSAKFKEVIELEPNRWVRIAPDLEIVCTPHDNGDSWIAERTPNGLILNVNDCVITSKKQCQKILDLVGPIHLLATQFSYANWVGNPGDHKAAAAAAAEKLSWMKTQIDTFCPKYVLPFASFVYFSHQENFFLNEDMTRIDVAVNFIREQTSVAPVVLFPGDRWDLGSEPPEVSSAIQKYTDARQKVLSQGFIHSSQRISLETLASHGKKFVDTLRKKNGWIIRMLPPALVHLDDLNATVKISASGVRPNPTPRATCDIACTSDALNYCFLNEWGGRTLDINARFQVPPRGHYWKFKTWATIANFNSRGEGFGQILATIANRL